MNVEFERNQSALTCLQNKWLIYLVGCISFMGIGFLILYYIWEPIYAYRWILSSVVVIAYQLWLLRTNLIYNHRIGEEELLPGLGWGNSLTLTRGLLFAGLTGFLLSPRPPGNLAWIPALLYTVGALIDFLDGYAARTTNQVTKLGEVLDMSMDGWGLLTASFLAVRYGQVPIWYLLVGLARYLYLIGLWGWKRLGYEIHDLPESSIRRPFAGLQMGFAFVILWPIFSPPGTYYAAVIFSFPFLVAFIWDWLVVSGIVVPDFGKRWARVKPFLVHWLPLFFRLGVLVLIMLQFAVFGILSEYFFVDIMIAIFLLLGVAGRISAIAGLITLGFHQNIAALTSYQIVLVCVYGMILYLGTGYFSLWQAENRFITHKAGEMG